MTEELPADRIRERVKGFSVHRSGAEFEVHADGELLIGMGPNTAYNLATDLIQAFADWNKERPNR